MATWRSYPDRFACVRVEEVQVVGVDGDGGYLTDRNFGARVHLGYQSGQRADVIGLAGPDVSGQADRGVQVDFGAEVFAELDRQFGYPPEHSVARQGGLAQGTGP